MSDNQVSHSFEEQLSLNHQIYRSKIGEIVSNLQSLEFLLRSFLYEKCDPPHSLLPLGTLLYDFTVGDQVPENAMTSYNSLEKLVKRYNRLVHLDNNIDSEIVRLRDLIAHGRASAIQPSPNFRLIKYSSSTNGMVMVETSVEVTEAWLKNQLKLTSDAVNTVADCLNKLQGELDKPPHSANSDS